MSMTNTAIQKLKAEITGEVLAEVKIELQRVFKRLSYEEINPDKLKQLEKISQYLDKGKKKRVFGSSKQLEQYLSHLNGFE